MELFGIKFAPINVSLERRLQTLAAAGWFAVMTCGSIGHLLSTYLVLFTPWRWVVILYLIWIYTIDRKTSERGGRRSQWVRNWAWWKYLNNYYPHKSERIHFVELNPNKNYIFCHVPHGLLCASQFCALLTNAGGFPDLFPHHTPHGVTLKHMFEKPFHRELVLALGACDSSANSIDYLLGNPNGGNIVGIIIGGASESLITQPRQYKLILKNRRGFVKLALKHGSPLVPVVTFGETDLYDQAANPKGSLIRTVQEFIKKWTGIAPIIPIGRGFFQYTFGFIPRRTPLTTLVGRPIEVKKIDTPTQEQLDDLHSTFIEELTKLFEDHKHRYIENADDIRLEFE